jgi:NodT family efflux transporter outer membrane factor (OMF) lipoprotein
MDAGKSPVLRISFYMFKSGYCFILVLLLTACTLGPDPEEKPPVPIEETRGFINDIYMGQNSQSISRWWERLNDPLFSSYVDRLLVQNLDIQQAGERVIQARERVNTAYGSFYPTLGLDGSAARRFSPVESTAQNDRVYSNAYSAEANASWQIDLFGQLRRGAQSADASFQATLFDREALIHSMIAQLLRTRVAIAVNKELLDLAHQNTDNREKIYNIVNNRYSLGVSETSAGNVLLAKENYTSTKADTYRYERLLAGQLYNLDLLLGLLPGTTDPLAKDLTLMAPPLDVPVCLAADLIDRRPDLRASALRVQAANADIGVAMADLYPSLNLAASLGFSDDDRYNVFTAEQLAGSILSAITTRIFEGGKLRSNIRLQESEARELSAAYAYDILNAVREVETALKSEQEFIREIAYLEDSAQALKKADDIQQERYLSGILDLRELLETQQRRYATQQNLLLKRQERWNNRIDLYLALGGDWLANKREEDALSDVPPTPLPCGTSKTLPQNTFAMMTNTKGTEL